MYLQYNSQELKDWEELPPSIRWYLERVCVHIRKRNIKAVLAKKILPSRWTFKTRSTRPTKLPHYLVDVWSTEGDSFPHNKVFPFVWAQATEEDKERYGYDSVTDWTWFNEKRPVKNKLVTKSPSTSYSPTSPGPTPGPQRSPPRDQPRRVLQPPTPVASPQPQPEPQHQPGSSPIYPDLPGPVYRARYKDPIEATELNHLDTDILDSDIQSHLDKVEALVEKETRSPPNKRSRSPIPPPPEISIVEPSFTNCRLYGCTALDFGTDGSCSCHLRRKKFKAALRAARPHQSHPRAIHDPADPEWPEGIIRIG